MGEDAPGALDQPFTFEGVHKFLNPLWKFVSDYWPLASDLENIGSDGPVAEMSCFSMTLPCYSYDDPGAGVVEAFLDGPGGIEWIMRHVETEDWDLPAADLRLIQDATWGGLSIAYHNYNGKRSYNMGRLGDVERSFFANVKERYPAQYGHGPVIITGDYGHEVPIQTKEDIEFCIEYSEAFELMQSELPDPDSFENCSWVSAAFAHELCNVWRKVHGKRVVKWSPKETGDRYEQ
jgi:hypothetical protein